MRYSVTQFTTAMAVADSDAEQAQAVADADVDIVDILNQLCEIQVPGVDFEVPQHPVKNVNDVKFIVGQCASKMRLIVARSSDLKYTDRDEVDDLRAELAEAEAELESALDTVAELEARIESILHARKHGGT
jgi:hypothetical protein